MISYNRGPEQIVKITKDASEFLEELRIRYPPLTIVSTAAKLQRDEIGDGVSSFVILLGELLKDADKLRDMKVHPNTIVRGYRLAAKKAVRIIDSQAKRQQERSDLDILASAGFREELLTARMLDSVVEASQVALTQGVVDRSKVRFVRKMGGCLDDSRLIRGAAVCKEKADSGMPDTINDARIILLTCEPGITRLEVKMPGEGLFPMKVNIKTRGDLTSYKEMENGLKMVLPEKLAELNVNVLACERPLDERVKCRLALQNILAVDRLPRQDMILLSEATGARMVGSLRDLSCEDVGHADRVRIEKIELLRYTVFEGCDGATFLLRGSTVQALDEAEKAIRSALSVLEAAKEDSRIVPGGGAIEMDIAIQLKEFSNGFPGKEQVVIRFFADALMSLPRCLSENFGINPIDSLIDLKRHHAVGETSFGIGAKGCANGVCWDLAKVKMSIIERACQVASLMLRIDEQVMSKEITKFHKK